MKLNNKGLSLFEMIAVIIIIGVIATIAAPSISKYIGGTKLTTFVAYEDSMGDAAKNAVLDCVGKNATKCELPEKGETKNISLKYLIDEGFIDEITPPKGGSCDLNKSFVRVENRGNLNYKFKVCLYCDEYTSDEDICK